MSSTPLLLLLLLRASRSSSSQSRPGDYERYAICVRDITREPLAAATCISGSRCVTRLIKIPRDLLRRAHGQQGGNGREEREVERTRERERAEKTRGGAGLIRVDVRGRGARPVEEKSARHTLRSCVEFDSRSKYSIRDEISRRPSAMRGRS